jgi:natural product precursor
MKTLKANQIEKGHLSKREMAQVIGGSSCGCACRYANSGGSETDDNHNANAASGLHSPGGVHVTSIAQDDGTWLLVDQWMYIE